MIFKGKQISSARKKKKETADLCKLGKDKRGRGNSTVTTEMKVIRLLTLMLLYI
jgi:hypothetical protein